MPLPDVCHSTAEYLGKPLEELNIIACHLGAGSSMACIERGRCIDTTMGLTPLEGLPMAIRSGDIDPGRSLCGPSHIHWLCATALQFRCTLADGPLPDLTLLSLLSTCDVKVQSCTLLVLPT